MKIPPAPSLLAAVLLSGVCSHTRAAPCCPTEGPLRIVAFSAERLGSSDMDVCEGDALVDMRQAIADAVPSGFTCTPVVRLTRDNLASADAAVLAPSEVRGDRLAPDEQDALRGFLESGGNLLVIAENSWYRAWLNSIGAVAGFVFEDTTSRIVEITRRLDHPVLVGAAGRVRRIRIEAGGAMREIPPGSVVLGSEFFNRLPALIAQGQDEGHGCGVAVIWPDANAMMTWAPGRFGSHIAEPDNRILAGNTFAWIDTIRRGSDAEAPTFASIQAPPTLWPPNHRMVELVLGRDLIATLQDNCDPAPTWRVLDVESSEPPDDLGDGHFEPDWRIEEDRLFLRAERMGPRAGRTYTITLEARDRNGNTSVARVEIRVPHDQGRR